MSPSDADLQADARHIATLLSFAGAGVLCLAGAAVAWLCGRQDIAFWCCATSVLLGAQGLGWYALTKYVTHKM